MQIVKNLAEYSPQKPLVLSIGMFDGVHKGHQSILKELKTIAQNKNLETGILTFWPHPRLVLNPNDDLKLLNTLSEKSDLLEQFGVQNLFLKTFDEGFRNLSGEDFIKQVLVDQLNVKHLVVGYDHTFGKNRSGNYKLLEDLSESYGFEVEEMNALNIHNHIVSSTKIRKALTEGNIEEANQLLGYDYPLSGKVVHGKKLGRTIGFPTANIEVDEHKLLPKKGAYIVNVLVDNIEYKGMLSIGTNPTVNGENLSVEVNILDFNEDIYDKEITVKFKSFLHDEIKFESLEKLIDRLKEDEELTRIYR